jgi:uncharacterized protein (TIGR02466 family)
MTTHADDPSPTSVDNSKALLNEAMNCHQQGNLFDADRLYAQALELDPDNSQALRLRGILARERGDIDGSLKLLLRAASAAPDRPEPLGEIALSHMAAGELTEAETTLRRALAIAPDYVSGLTNLGALLQHRGYVKEAIELYYRVLDGEPDNVEVRCNLAKALTDIGNNEQALSECSLALEHSGQHPYALATLGAVQIDMECYAQARATLEEATLADPRDDMALVNLGLACYQLDDIDAATRHLRHAVDANPWNARAVADLANSLTASGSVAEALTLCKAFLEQHPGERMVVGAYALALHNDNNIEAALELSNFNNLVQVHRIDVPTAYATMDEFNAALSQRMRSHPSLIANPVSKSTLGGDQTGELDLNSDPALAALGAAINQVINSAANQYRQAGLSNHPLMAPAAELWTLRSWGTVLHAGGRQTPHMHPLGWLSGVYYAHLPADMSKPEPEAGWLEFGRPAERYFRKVEPPHWRHQPKSGELVLFPSWFWHQTLPFESADERVSIAFDVMPQASLQIL